MLIISLKIRFLPTKKLESSKYWYGKRGMVLLGGMLTWWHTSEPDSARNTTTSMVDRFVDMIVENDGDVTVALSVALLEALVDYIENTFVTVKRLALVSDNGPHFASYDMIMAIGEINRRLDASGSHLRISSYDFTEPQWDKDMYVYDSSRVIILLH